MVLPNWGEGGEIQTVFPDLLFKEKILRMPIVLHVRPSILMKNG
jgi:hypothetical protein